MADHVVLDIVFPVPNSASVPPPSPPALGDPDQLKEHVHPQPCNDEGEGEGKGEADKLLSGSCMSPGDGTIGDGALDLTKSVPPVLVDCRICQEEEESGNLEIPCACSGSLKYAHRKCVQRWCNEKGDTTCEICHQPYKNGYEAPAQREISNDSSVELRYTSSNGNRGADAQHLEMQDPTVLAVWEAEYDYTIENGRVAACCRSAALILMSLLLFRHVLGIAASGSDEDTSAFFALFLLKAAGFLLPCYVIARAVSILQHRRQTQVAEVAELESASLVQAEEAARMQLPSPVSY